MTLITIADLGKFVSAFILWLYRGCGRIKVKLTQLCQKRKMKGIGKMDGQLYNRQRRGYIEPTALESTKLSEETGEDEDDDDEDTVPPLFVMMVLLGEALSLS